MLRLPETASRGVWGRVVWVQASKYRIKQTGLRAPQDWLLTTGYRLPATGYWLLATGYHAGHRRNAFAPGLTLFTADLSLGENAKTAEMRPFGAFEDSHFEFV